MAATMASSMSLRNPKCSSTPHKPLLPSSSTKSITIPSKLKTTSSSTLTATSSAAIASAIFTTLSTSDAAFAVQQVTDLAEKAGSDNRGTLLLLVVAPAIGWVLFNILQPALNQINKMRSDKSVIIGLGLGGGLMALAGSENKALAAVGELGSLAAAGEAASDNRGTLLLLVVAPAIGWVLFNILQPALNQINRMRSD